MPWDIVSQVLIYDILALYRVVSMPVDGYVSKSTKKYSQILTNPPEKCRTFDLELDAIKKYKEMGTYDVEDLDMITKYDVRVGDILLIRDTVRQEAYVVKSTEYLELEPYTPFFKHYDCLIKPFTGRIQLTNDSYVTFEKEYFPIDLYD
jgi:hypothetical protein